MNENLPAPTNQSAIIPQVSPKAISRKIKRIHNPNKPLTKKQLAIFEAYETGMTQEAIAESIQANQSYVNHVLRHCAKRYTTNKEYLKLRSVNILSKNIEVKKDQQSKKDVVDIVMDLNTLINPKIDTINVIDKQLTLNIAEDELDKLSMEDKVERVRRALSGD